MRFDFCHPIKCTGHGPQRWPWYRLVVPHFCGIGYDMSLGTRRGVRLWLYTRWGSPSITLLWFKPEREVLLVKLGIAAQLAYYSREENDLFPIRKRLHQEVGKVLAEVKAFNEAEGKRRTRVYDKGNDHVRSEHVDEQPRMGDTAGDSPSDDA